MESDAFALLLINELKQEEEKHMKAFLINHFLAINQHYKTFKSIPKLPGSFVKHAQVSL